MSEQLIRVPGKFVPFEAGTPLMDEKDIKKTSQVDSEDVKTEGGVLKFADKAYVPNDFSGMGRVYLRKNMINDGLHFADIISDLPSTETETLFDCDEIVYETTNNRFLAVKHTSEGKKYYPNYQFTGSEAYSEPDNKHIYVCDTNAKLYTYENGALEETTTLMDKNVLTQDMINKPNTIYIIQYDYDIVDMVNDTTTNNLTIGGEYYSYKAITIEDNQTYRALNNCVFIDYHHNSLIGSVLVTGENESQDFAIAKKSSAASGVPVSYYKPEGTINVPVNCVLQFEGGSIKSGTIVGNGTTLAGQRNCISQSVALSGTWVDVPVESNWFSIISDCVLDENKEYVSGTDNIQGFTNLFIFKNISINAGTYYLKGTISVKSGTKVSGNNAVIKGEFANKYKSIFEIGHTDYTENVNISNLNIIGWKAESSEVTEYCHGLCIEKACNVVLSNVNVLKCRGDGIYIGGVDENDELYPKQININNAVVDGCHRNGISVTGGENIMLGNIWIKNIGGTHPQLDLDIEPNSDSTVKHVIVDNCIFDSNNTYSVGIDSIYGNRIFDIVVKNTEFKGLKVSNCDNVTIDSCKSSKRIETSTLNIKNLKVINNIISTTNNGFVMFFANETIYENIIVRNNLFADIADYAIHIADKVGNSSIKQLCIENNTFVRCLRSIFVRTGEYCSYANNSIREPIAGGSLVVLQDDPTTRINIGLPKSYCSYGHVYEKGYTYINNNNIPVTYDGSRFIEPDGAKSGVVRAGSITVRPTLGDIYVGFTYFCIASFQVNNTDYPAGVYCYRGGTQYHIWMSPEGVNIADENMPTRE